MSSGNSAVKKIALLGAESTGKTALARSLALRFQTIWVPDVASEYIFDNREGITAEEIVNIAQEQLAQEERMENGANTFLFVDTELIGSSVWCRDLFGKCPEWIEKKIATHRYDLYLLTANDLPWSPDPTRGNSQRRDYFYNWYKRELEERRLPFEIITGRYEARLLSAIKALKKHFGDFD